MVQGMSSDEEVGKNSAWAGVPLWSSANNILLEGTACSAPSSFVEIPVHRDARFLCKKNQGRLPTYGVLQVAPRRPVRRQLGCPVSKRCRGPNAPECSRCRPHSRKAL